MLQQRIDTPKTHIRKIKNNNRFFYKKKKKKHFFTDLEKCGTLVLYSLPLEYGLWLFRSPLRFDRKDTDR